ncbi:hypothetical protein X975_01195, partial [Stegodyphus mimosarum]
MTESENEKNSSGQKRRARLTSLTGLTPKKGTRIHPLYHLHLNPLPRNLPRPIRRSSVSSLEKKSKPSFLP